MDAVTVADVSEDTSPSVQPLEIKGSLEDCVGLGGNAIAEKPLQICTFRLSTSGRLTAVPGIVAISCLVASNVSSPSNFWTHARKLRAAGHLDTK